MSTAPATPLRQPMMEDVPIRKFGGKTQRDCVRVVSDAQVEIAARLRQARAILSLFGGLGRAHKIAVRETAG